MKILIFGLGAIGQRHLRIIKKLCPSSRIATFRKTRHNILINDDLSAEPVEDLCDNLKVKELFSINQVIEYQPSHVLDCRIPPAHMDIPIEIVNENTKFFVEKPLTSLPISKFKLRELFINKYNNIFVGYHLAQHPLLNKLCALIKDLEIISYQINYCEFLPAMQPFRDYKAMHEFDETTSGGIEYAFSHALHLPFFIFKNKPELISFIKNKESHLGLLTPSESSFHLKHYKSSSKSFFGKIELSYLSHMPLHTISINTNKNTIFFDIDNAKLKLFNNHSLEEEYSSNINKMELLTLQMAEFLQVKPPDYLSQYKKYPLCELNTAIEICKLCEELVVTNN